ncbi:MAG: glycosyltransferase family 9 protein [Candidatus Omnitrophica bacterium]|nr:glycosyltransferase family 9 protein [Candidatus Omnitrophota bacterium]
MFFRLSPKSRVKKILVVSLSNIGDVVLTFPVIDSLKEAFPAAELHIIVGPKGKSLLTNNPSIAQVILLDKAASLQEKWQWFLKLRRQRFDVIVDLRNSMLPFLLHARYITWPDIFPPHGHSREKHLKRLESVLSGKISSREKYSLFLSSEDQMGAQKSICGKKGYVLFSPGAADNRKRWSEEGFARAIRHVVSAYGKSVVIVGDDKDRQVVERIVKNSPAGVINACGLTTLTELCCIIREASLAVTNDSGVMHLASYLGIPTIALFGPTDPLVYGPWSEGSEALYKGRTMSDISIKDVIDVLDKKLRKI